MDTPIIPNSTSGTDEPHTGGSEHFLTETEIIIALTFIYLGDIFAIVANIFVIFAFLSDRALQIPRNFYIVNLAICDLIIGVFIVPFYSSTIATGDWVMSVAFCVIWTIVNNIVVTVSHLSIFLIAYDRYMLVSDVVKYNNTETAFKAKFRVGLCWVIVTLIKLLFVLLTEYYYTVKQDPEYASCSPKSTAEIPYIIGVKAYDITFTCIAMVFEVFVPLVFIVIFHWRVLHSIQKKSRRTSAMCTLINGSTQLQVMADVHLQEHRPLPLRPIRSQASLPAGPTDSKDVSHMPKVMTMDTVLPNQIEKEIDSCFTEDGITVIPESSESDLDEDISSEDMVKNYTLLDEPAKISDTLRLESYASTENALDSISNHQSNEESNQLAGNDLEKSTTTDKTHTETDEITGESKSDLNESSQTKDTLDKPQVTTPSELSGSETLVVPGPSEPLEPEKEDLKTKHNEIQERTCYSPTHTDFKGNIKRALEKNQIQVYQCMGCKEYIALVSSVKPNHLPCACVQIRPTNNRVIGHEKVDVESQYPLNDSRDQELTPIKQSQCIENIKDTTSISCSNIQQVSSNEVYTRGDPLDKKQETSNDQENITQNELDIEANVGTSSQTSASDTNDASVPTEQPLKTSSPQPNKHETLKYRAPISFIKLPRSISEYFDHTTHDNSALDSTLSSLSSDLSDVSVFELEYYSKINSEPDTLDASSLDRTTKTSESTQVQSKRQQSDSAASRPKSVRFQQQPQVMTQFVHSRLRNPRKSVQLMTRYRRKFDRRAAITITLLILFFVIFKLPLATVMIIEAVCGDCIGTKLLEGFTWMFWAKSLINPFLYAFISKRFRCYSLNFFKRHCACCSNNKITSFPSHTM